MTLHDAVDTIFQMKLEGRKEFHFDEIAVAITMHINEFKTKEPDTLKREIQKYLYNSSTKISRGRRVEDINGKYQRVRNGRGGFKNGVYKLRKQRQQTPSLKYIIKATSIQNTNNTRFIGAAGEMAVSSELLFRDYNISRMAVDDGVDIVATKNDITYYIQVKTTHVTDVKSFKVSITNESFSRYNNHKCYYVVVARGEKNYYLVFTADDIKRMQENGDIKSGVGTITINFSQKGDEHIYVKKEKVDYALNAFNRIY
jgi:Holliday junction resolvase